MNEITIFKNELGEDITLEHLYRKIYNLHEEKNKNILASVEHLKDRIVTIQDAIVIMPSLVELQKTAVMNDEKLVKLAILVQKMNIKSNNTPIDGYIMSADEREELLKNYKSKPDAGSAANSE